MGHKILQLFVFVCLFSGLEAISYFGAGLTVIFLFINLKLI